MSSGLTGDGRLQQLVGRDEELGLLSAAISEIRDHGSALILSGEAGIGKSVLLDAARRRAESDGLRVLRTAGVVAESDLPYSGLHRLLRPVMPSAGDLPDIRRAALLSAFGLGDGTGADPFLVALSTLELLAAQAANTPMVLLVDDLHWIDAASRDALTFVGRRLDSDPIVMLATLRDGYEAEIGDHGLPVRELARLSDREARLVLDMRAPDLDPGLRSLLLREAIGNPLALVELPTTIEVSAGRLAGGDVAALSDRLERAFAARLADMPEDARTLLLAAAADESLGIPEILRTAEVVLRRQANLAMLQPAVDARLVSVDDGGLRFRHPLVRSAIYQEATIERRLAVHGALTEVLAGQPDRRAWHRAAATAGCDDEVANEVEQMAARMQGRGASLQAAIVYGRAARLSEDQDARARRLLRAGELAFDAGRADLVRDFVSEARGLELDDRQTARSEWLSEIFYDGEPGDPDRVIALVNLAESAASDGDEELALTLLHAAGLRSWWGDPGAEVRLMVAAAVDRMRLPSSDHRALAIVAMAEPIARSESVMAGIEAARPQSDTPAEVALRLGMAAHAVGDWDRSLRILPIAIDALRQQGRLGLLTHAVGMFTSGAVFAGDWALATPAAADFEQLARETNQPVWRAGAAFAQTAVAGVAGDTEQSERFAADAARVLHSDQASDILCVLEAARGLAALTAGRHEDAYAHLARTFDPADPAYHHREKYNSLGYFAEAAVLTGRTEHIRGLLPELIERAAPDADRAMLVGVWYARAVLADDDVAEPQFAAALAATGKRWKFNRARLHLAYGAWLRRRRRVTESREPLREARDAFDELGVAPWGDRARRELRAAGETVARRSREAWDQLSPQELQIAQLAASGLSNREIGQRMYLSHRTVASHLYRIFPKLGITSRSQLSGVLPARADGADETP